MTGKVLIQPTLKDRAMVLLMTCMMFFYPILAGAILSVFACYRPDMDERSDSEWVLEMGTKCFQGQHRVLTLTLGVIGLLLGVVLPPVVMFTLLFRRREKLYEERTMVRFLFLYHGYRDHLLYWEGVKMLYLLALVCVRVLGRSLRDEERLGVFLAVLVAYAFLLMALRPHHFVTIFRLEMGSLAIATATTYVLMFGLFDKEGGFSD